MKIDVEKLINEVSKHPEIYNPDHKDFSNKELRNKIFNTVINKDMNGINGEMLQHKWDQILNKYANFIRKLSNDDSSEKVLELFMKWPWTKPMRIFKPYVRKQFQIPEFQSATQLIPDMEIPHIPMVALQPLHTIPIINGPSDEDGSEFPFPLPTAQESELRGVGFAGQIPVVRHATLSPPTTNEGHSNANDTPATSRATDTQLTHPIPEPSLEIPRTSTMEIVELPAMPDMQFVGPEFIVPAAGLPQFFENLSGMLSPLNSNDVNENYNNQMGSNITAAIRRMMERFPIDNVNIDGDDENDDDDGEDDEDDDDNDNASDDEISTDDEGVSTVDDGPSSAKKRREQSSEDSDKDDKGTESDTSCTGDNGDDDRSDVLPDLPQPKPEVKRGPLDFSAQEHIFLAWAKTMSTFTAKRQATVKMQINKIMSEAEFEDLDDEFFAANKKPRRSIYTSRY